MPLSNIVDFMRQQGRKHGRPEIDGFAWLRGEIVPADPGTLIVFEGDVEIDSSQWDKLGEGWTILITGTLTVMPDKPQPAGNGA